MTQYSLDLALSVLKNGLNSPDNDIVSDNATKSLPVIKQSHNMYCLLKELNGKFDNSLNNYNQEIDDILGYIDDDMNEIEKEKEDG